MKHYNIKFNKIQQFFKKNTKKVIKKNKKHIMNKKHCKKKRNMIISIQREKTKGKEMLENEGKRRKS